MSLIARSKELTKENAALRREVKLLRHALVMLSEQDPSAHTAILAGIISRDGQYEVTLKENQP